MAANAPLPEPPLLLAQLRASTRALHASLDASVGGDVTRSVASYARFLTGSRIAVRAIEGGIEARLGPDFAAGRASLLDADLAALQRSGAGATSAVVFEQMLIRDDATAFGAAYVLEGSALGGLVMADRARAALGPDVPTAYLSYRGRGAGTGNRWKWFQEQLAAFGARSDTAAHARATAAARAAFDLYARAFSSAS